MRSTRTTLADHRAVLVALAAAALSLTLLAGCGSSSSNSSATSTPTGADAGAASTAPGGSKVTCSQITTDDIQPLVDGTPQAPTITAEGQDSTGQQCVFTVSAPDGGGGRAVDILVESGSLATDGYAQELASAKGAVMLTGIGDKGFRETGDDQVTALKGDTYCSVTLGSGDTIKGVGPIEAAHGGTSDIGEPNNSIVAAALGTLCNRIFGSGNTTPDLSGLS